MDNQTKMRALARHDWMKTVNGRKYAHRGDGAIGARGEVLDVAGAYEAAGRGSDMRGIESALNAHGGLPVNDEPMVHTEVAGSSMCYSYDELMMAVDQRTTVGDQIQPTPGHTGWTGCIAFNGRRDVDEDGF